MMYNEKNVHVLSCKLKEASISLDTLIKIKRHLKKTVNLELDMARVVDSINYSIESVIKRIIEDCKIELEKS